ncbi:MAG: MerR family transcriptional regulator [Clostridiales bacterium]|nr:MerR family transcriptional regulator [Clostridiales bacterium]
MNIKELAKLSGVSVRTLHHYYHIGLLCPKRDPNNTYRKYEQTELDRLQQILLFRGCGFSLFVIGQLLDSPAFDPEDAFLLQRKALQHEQVRLENMLSTLDLSLDALRGKNKMTDKDKFKGFDFSKNPYEKEARELYGDAAVDKSREKMKSLGKQGQDNLQQDMNELFEGLAALRYLAPESSEVQEMMAGMYLYFNDSFGYHYSPEAFKGLGQMYADDERFTKNIDSFGEGLSEFLKEAMSLFADGLQG